MSKPELLNLDELSIASKKVQIKGEVYDLSERTIGQTITAISIARKIEKEQSKGELSPEDIIETVFQSVKDIIPECPESTLRSMTMAQIKRLMEYAGQTDDETLQEASEAARPTM